MASVDLNFTKEDKVYVADIVSPGKCIVQIERKKSGWTTIVSKIIFRSKNIVRPISQLVEKQMNYS